MNVYVNNQITYFGVTTEYVCVLGQRSIIFVFQIQMFLKQRERNNSAREIYPLALKEKQCNKKSNH